jgi:uncharacterized protein (TIGR04255 family)
MSEGEVRVTAPPVTEDGYMFLTSDGKRILQARLDGFTLSQLKPYGTWEALRDEAKELWARYVEIARPERVNRIALRYINRIDLPLPISDFGNYLRIVPDIQGDLPKAIRHFFLRVEIPYPTGVLAIITETIIPTDPATAPTLPLIFDIDAIRPDTVLPPFAELWDRFEELRTLKNDIFFGAITSEAERLFQ